MFCASLYVSLSGLGTFLPALTLPGHLQSKGMKWAEIASFVNAEEVKVYSLYQKYWVMKAVTLLSACTGTRTRTQMYILIKNQEISFDRKG